MGAGLKETFERLWQEHFPGAELPICCWHADAPGDAEAVKPATGHRCVIADLARVRRGASLAFDAAAVSCFGGRKYFGFPVEIGEDFPYFLSYGIPGKLEGERYKKTPSSSANGSRPPGRSPPRPGLS